jgi:hypothetical protein
VQDRPVEPAELGELGVRVERVPVAGEPVGERLVGPRRVRDHRIGIALGRHVARARRSAVTAPTAFAADEHRVAGGEHRFARFGIDRLGLVDDHGGRALVVDADYSCGGEDLALGRDLAVQFDRLLAVDEHRQVERPDVTHADADDHRERRQHALLDALGVLGGEREFETGWVDRTGAHAHGVEQTVLRVPRTLARRARLGVGSVRVDRHVLLR